MTARLLQSIFGITTHSTDRAFASLFGMAVRQSPRIVATNGTALGFSDIGDVTSIKCYVTATNAPCVQALLKPGIDFIAIGNDVKPIGDHRTETWIITYRPYL